MSDLNEKDINNDVGVSRDDTRDSQDEQLEQPKVSWRKAILPVFACGAGLFSDGYVNNVRSQLSSRFVSISLTSPRSSALSIPS